MKKRRFRSLLAVLLTALLFLPAPGALAAGEKSPITIPDTGLSEEQKIVHLLNRLGYGPRPRDLAPAPPPRRPRPASPPATAPPPPPARARRGGPPPPPAAPRRPRAAAPARRGGGGRGGRGPRHRHRGRAGTPL